MDNPADLINVAIEMLVKDRYELPGFNSLNRLVCRLRTRVNHQLFSQITQQLDDQYLTHLDRLLENYPVHQLELPAFWGKGTSAAADGTKYDLYEQNLLSEYHIRYGGYGGIAYHHVADSYIALFSHFIPCGTWEAVYIIDGLLKNSSLIQPKTLHADTQGQSTPVFALSHLLGIKLMPRIRN